MNTGILAIRGWMKSQRANGRRGKASGRDVARHPGKRARSTSRAASLDVARRRSERQAHHQREYALYDGVGDGAGGVKENRRSGMTAKEYLRRIRDTESDLRSAEQDYQRARDDVMNLKAIQYDKDKVSNSHIGDLSDAIAALEKYAERVNAKWDELIAMREEAKERIGEIADGRYREVLHRRYLQGESWEYIAVGMGYTYHHIHKLHGQALNEFEAVF